MTDILDVQKKDLTDTMKSESNKKHGIWKPDIPERNKRKERNNK